MKWADHSKRFVNGGFCESLLYSPGTPEYANSFSCVFLLLFGILGCTQTNAKHDSQFVRAYAMMIVNSVGSFGYHWTGQYGWQLIDECSMILASTTGCSILLDELFVPYRSLYMTSISLYQVFSIALIASGTDVALLFTIPLLCILFVTVILAYTDQTNAAARILLWTGLGVSLSSAAVWITTEQLCDRIEIFRWLYGHVMWHAGMSYGLHLVYCFIAWVRADNAGYVPFIKKWYGLPYAVVYELPN